MIEISWREYDFRGVAEGRLFFYVGAGISQAAGLVGWNDMADKISRFRRTYEGDKNDTPPNRDKAKKNAAYLRQFVEQKDLKDKQILSRDSKSVRTFGRTVLLNLLLRCRKSGRWLVPITELSLELHASIWRTKCQGIFTTNYDMLLEEAFDLIPPSERSLLYGHRSALRTYRYYAQFLPFLLSVPRFVLKMHGDVDDIGTMLFDPETAWKRGNHLFGRAGNDVRRAFDAACLAGHVVYIGCGGRDRTFLELHRSKCRADLGTHQRLFFTSAAEVAGIVAKVKKVGGNIDDFTFLTYGKVGHHPGHKLATSELQAFLDRLAGCKGSRDCILSHEAVSIRKQLQGARRVGREWITRDWDISGVRLAGSADDGDLAPGLTKAIRSSLRRRDS